MHLKKVLTYFIPLWLLSSCQIREQNEIKDMISQRINQTIFEIQKVKNEHSDFSQNKIITNLNEIAYPPLLCGLLWQLQIYTNDSILKDMAIISTKSIRKDNYIQKHNIEMIADIRSLKNCFLATGDSIYINQLNEWSLYFSSMFNAQIGCIKSTLSDNYLFPVVIDDLWILELLTCSAQLTGNNQFQRLAISHANKIMTNHYKENYCYCILDYDPTSGEILTQKRSSDSIENKERKYANAISLYWFTSMFLETNNSNYLKQAHLIANMDFITENIESSYSNMDPLTRAISAAGITRLIKHTTNDISRKKYIQYLEKVLKSFCFFNNHISLNVSEYFLLEAMINYMDITEQK